MSGIEFARDVAPNRLNLFPSYLVNYEIMTLFIPGDNDKATISFYKSYQAIVIIFNLFIT